jgi:hypothetical protein
MEKRGGSEEGVEGSEECACAAAQECLCSSSSLLSPALAGKPFSHTGMLVVMGILKSLILFTARLAARAMTACTPCKIAMAKFHLKRLFSTASRLPTASGEMRPAWA